MGTDADVGVGDGRGRVGRVCVCVCVLFVVVNSLSTASQTVLTPDPVTATSMLSLMRVSRELTRDNPELGSHATTAEAADRGFP